VDAGPQHTTQYIKPQEGESLRNYITRTGPYIEMLQERSIQEHINGTKMFWCHKNTRQACFMCDQNNVMILQYQTLQQIYNSLPENIKITYTNNEFTLKQG